MTTGFESVRTWAELTTEKRALEAALRKLNDQLAVVEDSALNYMADVGAESMTLKGLGTVHHIKRLWASIDSENPDALEALRAAGAGDMVKERVNTQSLSAWVREHDGEVPEVARPFVNIAETYKLGLRS